MNPILILGVNLLSFLQWDGRKIEVSLGPNYSSYLVFQNDEESKGKWQFGGEIGVSGMVPNLGVKLRGTRVKYQSGGYAWEYTPVSLCTSFNALPFLDGPSLGLSIETGLGVYFWRELYENEVMVLPTGDRADERDIGFVGGATVQFRPTRFLALESSTRYNYMATSNTYKYGFDDKDDKLWETGLGLRVILP